MKTTSKSLTKLTKIRETAGLSIEDMAEKMGISPAAYRNIETCGNPTLTQTHKASEILGITPEQAGPVWFPSFFSTK